MGDRAPLWRGWRVVSGRRRPPDPAAQLIERCDAEAVGALDNQCVRARDIEAGFDDRRRHQHVIFAVVKGAHPLLDLARRHLAVRDDIFDLGHPRAQEFLDVGQVLDAWGDEEALPAAIMRSEEHTSELQSLMRISYAVSRLK